MKHLTGNTYGSWIVIGESAVIADRTKLRLWLCRCKCGKEVLVNEKNLVAGRSKSCLYCRPKNIKHGGSSAGREHRLYSTWKSMRARCYNPKTMHYEHYGGRGITVCKEWDDFQVFLNDMESTFQEGLTLDREDNDGNYNKNNCRWATKEQQANNQRDNLRLEFEGKIVTEAELAKLTGVPRTTLQTRRRKGASVEEMVYGFK
jgi:hypothetical protein